MANGRFITLEGGEGAGKSTQVETVCDFLATHNIDFIRTREPGGTPASEAIREVLLAPKFKGLSVDTELLLMFAARAEHLHQLIRPALQQGRWVVCDRFTDASYAYQGGGRGIPNQRIAVLEEWVQQGLQPDLTLLLDCEPKIGMARITGRGVKDRFEVEAQVFFEKVRHAYLDRAKVEPERFRLIDADQDSATVATQIEQVLAEFIAQ